MPVAYLNIAMRAEPPSARFANGESVSGGPVVGGVPPQAEVLFPFGLIHYQDQQLQTTDNF